MVESHGVQPPGGAGVQHKFLIQPRHKFLDWDSVGIRIRQNAVLIRNSPVRNVPTKFLKRVSSNSAA